MRRVRRDSHSVPPDLARACANAGEPDFGNQDKLRWHAQQTGNVLAVLKTGPDGLTAQEAESRKQRFGPNRLAAAPKRSEILHFLSQFNNVLIYVLLAAAGLALAIGHIADALVVLAVVLLNAVIGYVQEGRAAKALDAIRGMIDPRATVIRDGRRTTIAAESIVPGDLVLLEPGDRVPADLRLIRVRNLRTDEAALTGESVPVDKAVEPAPADAPLSDRTSMAFSGTFVASGNGTGIAVATGAASQLGRISTLVGAIETLTTPLVRQMNDLARKLTVIILAASVAVFAFAVLVRGYHWQEAFMVMIGLVVAAIPEGLPAVMTITLAIGVQRMAARNAIVRYLPAVETLGSVSVICSDKTGTLTRNEMTVRTVLTTEGQFDVSGAGYRPKGEFEVHGKLIESAAYPILVEAARAAILCNDAELRTTDGIWIVHGDPMEGALVSFGVKAGHDAGLLRKQFPRTDEIPFDTQHQFMATLHHSHEDGIAFAYIKGAPERLLEMCSRQRGLSGDEPLDLDLWHKRTHAMARQGRRMLAVAVKTLSRDKRDLSFSDVEHGATFLGLIGLIDPPREEALAAIRECHEAGIRVMMITGDHAATAEAIARELRLAPDPKTTTGHAIDRLDDARLKDVVRDT
ncbi:MAG TPA: HAD-IC family P-type ATPase, partial [Methyloceanibacter sp.]|nr:HAD-IC family P-type ATPase [Methyloceanibacter sp.]